MNNEFFSILNVNEYHYLLLALFLPASFYFFSLVIWISWVPYQKKSQSFLKHKIVLIPSKKYLWNTNAFLLIIIALCNGAPQIFINSNKNRLLFLNRVYEQDLSVQIHQYYDNLSIILGSISGFVIFMWIVIQIFRFIRTSKKVNDSLLNDWVKNSLLIEKENNKMTDILDLNFGYNPKAYLRVINKFHKDIKEAQNLKEKYYYFSDLILTIMRYSLFLSKTKRKALLTNVYVSTWNALNINN